MRHRSKEYVQYKRETDKSRERNRRDYDTKCNANIGNMHLKTHHK